LHYQIIIGGDLSLFEFACVALEMVAKLGIEASPGPSPLLSYPILSTPPLIAPQSIQLKFNHNNNIIIMSDKELESSDPLLESEAAEVSEEAAAAEEGSTEDVLRDYFDRESEEETESKEAPTNKASEDDSKRKRLSKRAENARYTTGIDGNKPEIEYAEDNIEDFIEDDTDGAW
jgi:hypothetical protein